MAPTVFLCRWLGVYCLIVALSMALHRDAYISTVTALAHDAPLMLILGVFTTLGGLALVLVHNHWHADHYARVVTILAWTVLLKGLLWLFMGPPAAASFYLGTLRYAQLFFGYAALCALLGVYLCFGGFASRAPIPSARGRADTASVLR